ncbi:PREDICTED: protein GUCD1-like [Branchiostoma belcheri]|uniref:Protein GUCD1-like n=1 Tax=Branchiostoma belcheri TaxID=7741 RepID=A0A6P4Z2I6_BRABE|nr:PREDICTED: protein GUCD1-like [Branchiostoma belcheri]
MDEFCDDVKNSTQQSKDETSQPDNQPASSSDPPLVVNTSSDNSSCQEGSRKPSGVQQVLLNVPHIQQHFEWDCGLACTRMVLRHVLPSPPSADNFRALCEKMDVGCSVWTVDLAWIMAHYNIPHLLCTRTLGVDSGYQQESYYLDNFDKDKQRVNHLFTNAASLGIRTEKKTVTIQQIQEHLTKGNAAIVLVDSSKLHCVWCNEEKACCCWPCYMLWSCLSEDLDEEEVFVASELNKEVRSVAKNLSDSDDGKEVAKVPLEEETDESLHATAEISVTDQNKCEDNQTLEEKSDTKADSNKNPTNVDTREKFDKSGYQGHFIVVCGYSEEGILYRNPGLATDLCCCSLQSFEDARKSYGTDEDILFVYQQAGDNGTASM